MPLNDSVDRHCQHTRASTHVHPEYPREAAVGAAEQAMQQCQRKESKAHVMDRPPGSRPDPAPDGEAERDERHQIQADLPKSDPERLVAGAGERNQGLRQCVCQFQK